ncbi:aminoglycoside phosphotransferase family protein [Sphingomonas sp. AP4-R1]|uniref:phosphotransferase enzyme family protein n=1 Tax=Sphingomonas sp. AP4-R1 TaxID=2735134 RepID=UPI001493952F|nr:aminoglycoside phosphotransferase family protein [Sphingomonas sp. AP4-R1]QJU58468.1 aminoglycoside phosphotransferase family protein [Sphingomonas sp. AP4-R1]
MDVVAAFPFDHPGEPVSLYDYAPVLRVRDRRGDWVLKRTGLVHSDGEAIGQWLTALHGLGVDVVAPAAHLHPNPRRLEDGQEWVVYPFVSGTGYHADESEIVDAGRLLGRMHAADPPEANALAIYSEPMVRDAEWIEPHLVLAEDAIETAGADRRAFREATRARLATAEPVMGLPLAGCSFDFKASNLVFSPKPTLVDPDHAARMPRLYDLAVALLLFHCDLSTAPGRLWTPNEWAAFLMGYAEHVVFTDAELAAWSSILELAWLDQGIWLLGNWPEGWADAKDRAYLLDVATFDPAVFPLTHPDHIASG